jgi:hypothetical protein
MNNRLQPQLDVAEKVTTTKAGPKSVSRAQVVELVLVTYHNEGGKEIRQLALRGEENVFLINSQPLGISEKATPQQIAPEWLRAGVEELLVAAPKPVRGKNKKEKQG